MRIPLAKRLVMTFFNIFFPPLAVLLICGPNEDFVFNCVMFLLAVIPSHVHGFYISLTYFNRKRKVRKGLYPGRPKSLIWSDKVNNGGASDREVAALKRQTQEGRPTSKMGRKATNPSTPRTNRVEDWDDGYKEDDGPITPRPLGRSNTRRSGRSQRTQTTPRRGYHGDEADY